MEFGVNRIDAIHVHGEGRRRHGTLQCLGVFDTSIAIKSLGSPQTTLAGIDEWWRWIRRAPLESAMYPNVNSTFTSSPLGRVKK